MVVAQSGVPCEEKRMCNKQKKPLMLDARICRRTENSGCGSGLCTTLIFRTAREMYAVIQAPGDYTYEIFREQGNNIPASVPGWLVLTSPDHP